MASSDPDRGRPSSAPDKPENPFIRFKQFTDAKVSAVLRGIIGLPSPLSNKNDPKTRFTGFDDDLKPRDELRARQLSMEASESRKSEVDETEREASAKQPADSSTRRGDSDGTRKAMDDEGEICDIEFYSPVTKSLFAHLNRQQDGENTEWKNPSSTSSGFAWDVFGTCWPGNIYRLSDDQMSSNPLIMVQAMALNTLNRTAKRPECRWFHSDQSVLPYILFSPYSPLALCRQPAPLPAPWPKDSLVSKTEAQLGNHAEISDERRWCNAFEDLLLASSGREMRPFDQQHPPHSESRHSWDDRIRRSRCAQIENKQAANHAMTWINGLQARGLLEPHLYNHPPLSEVGLLLSLLSPLVLTSKSQRDLEAAESDLPQTEQEMYDRFFGSSSSSESKNPSWETRSSFGDITSILQKMGDEVKSFEQVLDQLEAWKNRKFESFSSGDEATKRNSEAKKGFNFESFLRGHPHQNSASTQTDMDEDNPPNNIYETSKSEEGQSQEQVGKNNDRIVSTSTTTEQYVSANGTKTTTVTVTKCFGDGKSVTTESTHSETPGYTDTRKFWEEDNESGKSEGKVSENDANLTRNRGKGWFWN